MANFAELYQNEVEEKLNLVKTQKIPASDWKAAEEQLTSCKQTIQMMEQAARSSHNKNALSIANSLKTEVNSLIDEVQKKSLLNKSQFDDDDEKPSMEDDEEEEKKTLMSSKNALTSAKQNLSRIQQTGAGILSDLEDQSGTMDRISGKVNQTNTSIASSRATLRTIEHNAMRQKIFIYGAIGLVMAGLIFLCYWIFFRLS